MKEHEPHLYVNENRWLCYLGKDWSDCTRGKHSFGVRNITFLSMLKYLDKIEVTPTRIIFYETDSSSYSIPHTPNTFRECQQIIKEYR